MKNFLKTLSENPWKCIAILAIIVCACCSFSSKKETLASSITLEYYNGQAFYVLNNSSGPVAFIKK